jgi:dTDP-4-dehydrorhamnose reductase
MNMRKLLIFGGGGFVGGNIAKMATRNGWHVTVADSFYRPGLDGVEWIDLNITDKDAVAAVVNGVKPDAAVNVAAIADIDKAERDKDIAYKVNVDGARYAAESCAAVGSRYIFFSSDAVFDGEIAGVDAGVGEITGNGAGTGAGSSKNSGVNEDNGASAGIVIGAGACAGACTGACTIAGYREGDVHAPVNYYGVTKSEAETAILSVNPDAVIIRISLVIGFPVTGGNSFFDGLRAKLADGAEVTCPVSEVRTPVDVLTLSECILELAESRFAGVVHIGAVDSINRYELTKKAAAAIGYGTDLIKMQTGGGGAPGRAPRHKNGIICVEKAQKIFKTKMLTVDESVKRAIMSMNQ